MILSTISSMCAAKSPWSLPARRTNFLGPPRHRLRKNEALGFCGQLLALPVHALHQRRWFPPWAPALSCAPARLSAGPQPRRFFQHSSRTIETLFASSEGREPQPLALKVEITLAASATVSDVSSANVLGWMPGTEAPSPKSAMHRLKAAFAQRLRSRLEHNQTHEPLLRAHLLNRWPTPSTLSVA